MKDGRSSYGTAPAAALLARLRPGTHSAHRPRAAVPGLRLLRSFPRRALLRKRPTPRPCLPIVLQAQSKPHQSSRPIPQLTPDPVHRPAAPDTRHLRHPRPTTHPRRPSRTTVCTPCTTISSPDHLHQSTSHSHQSTSHSPISPRQPKLVPVPSRLPILRSHLPILDGWVRKRPAMRQQRRRRPTPHAARDRDATRAASLGDRHQQEGPSGSKTRRATHHRHRHPPLHSISIPVPIPTSQLPRSAPLLYCTLTRTQHSW